MKLWQKVPGKLKLTLRGLNVEKFINLLVNSGFEILETERQEYNKFHLVIHSKDSKKILELAQKFGYIVDVDKAFGFYKIVDFAIKRFSLVVCLIFCLSVYFFSNLFVWSINIDGINNINKHDIIDFLSENDICVGKAKKNINISQIEQSLLSNFKQIALVSVYLYGNSINIAINEKLPQEYLNYLPLVSEFDGVIRQIELVSGTSNLKVGDVVRQGDILVLPYIIDNSGNKKSIKPQANIVLEVDFNTTISYNEDRKILEDTGNKMVSTNIFLYGLKLKKDKLCLFENYRKEVKETYVLNNLFLPIKKIETMYYEQTYVDKIIPFEEVRDELINQAYDIVINKAKGFEIVGKKHDIIKKDKNYYITTICKAIVYLGEKL